MSTKPKRIIRIDELRILASGNFFRLPTEIEASSIETFFKGVVRKWATGRPIANEIAIARNANGSKFKYSFLCFKLRPSVPPFLPDSDLQEISYAFVVLLQVDGILGIFKRGPVRFEDWVSAHCNSIEPKALTRIFGEEANYQKLSLRRMTISKSELRGASYEAEDLSETIPNLGLNRSIPKFIRLSHPIAGAISITPGTSRIQKSGGRLTIDELAAAVSGISKELSLNVTNPFLDSFPIPEVISLFPKEGKPTGILFELPFQTDGQSVWQIMLKKSNGQTVDVTEEIRQRFQAVVETRPVNGGWEFGDINCAHGTISRTSKGYVVELEDISSTLVKNENGYEESFATWIKRTKPFSICFDSPEWFYTQGELYRRAQFNNDIALVEGALFEMQGMSDVTSEKGNTTHYTKSTTRFDKDSIFAFVENDLCKGDQHLLCCDLNDEWADYIAMNRTSDGGSIRFLHCKNASVTSGASAFHEVIGQALKNLGRLQITPQVFSEKIEDLIIQKNWKEEVPIPRYRGSGNIDADLAALIANPETQKEVILVVSFVSKDRFKSEKSELKLKPYFVQMIWIVSAFLHSCREMGAKGKIVCKNQ